MNKTMLCAAVLLAFAAFPAAELPAQMPDGDAQPGEDVMSLAAVGGGFYSANELSEGTEFENTESYGAMASFWTHRNIGLRASVLWASPTVLSTEENALANEDPTVWNYSGDVLLRMPMTATDQVSWFPYIVGGIGAKTYDFQTLETGTDLAGNVGAGLELRFGETGRFGITTEVRDYLSSFDRLGFDETQNDVIWTGGLTMNF